MGETDNKLTEEAIDQKSGEESLAEAAATETLDEATAMQRQLEEQKNDYLRLAAEFDNYRKRTTREFAGLVKTANENLIGELLEVLDNFERAFKSREEKPDFEAYHKGITLVHDRLVTILGRAGLKKFESIGQKFDPNWHEAMMQVDAADQEPDTIALEIQPGYELNDKVIRHAKVGVVKAAEPKEENK